MIASLLSVATVARAATLCVNTTGTGGCFASIQPAVDAAGSGDVIDIAAGTYVENVAIGPGSRLTIQGASATSTIIQGNGVSWDRVLHFSGPRTRVTLRGVTVRNGGIGVRTREGAVLDIEDVIIADNSNRGILCGARRVSVSASTISGNSVAGVESAGFGPCFLKIQRSLITGNDTGILATRRLLLEDSTVSGNADVGLSAISRSSLRVRRSTIVDNGSWGIRLDSVAGAGAPTCYLESTILANNAGPSFSADCRRGFGPVIERLVSRGFNLAEDCSIFFPGTIKATDILGIDPVLGPLQDNGGPTLTHAPLTGSPALGAVTRRRGCRKPDQRGVARAVPCDIGAYEAP